MKKGKGSGWHGESHRHSEARRYGRTSHRVRPHRDKYRDEYVQFRDQTDKAVDEYMATHPNTSREKVKKFFIRRAVDYANTLMYVSMYGQRPLDWMEEKGTEIGRSAKASFQGKKEAKA